MARLRFEFRPGLTIATVLALGLLIVLGSWQLHRLDWKRDLIAQVEARVNAPPIPFDEAVGRAEAGEAMEYAPVSVEGRLDADSAANVFGTYDGDAGVFAFAPLITASGRAVYVNAGFVPQEAMGSIAANAEEPTIVTGLLRYRERPTPPASWFQAKGKSVDGLWFIRDPVAFAADAQIDAFPYYIDQGVVPGRAWPKGGTTRLAFNNRHLEYALTWFGLAAALAGVWLVFSLKKAD